jgi:repressor LexA
MAATLYKRQKEILDYIKLYLVKNGNAPTLQEIADHFKLSSLATVHAHLKKLEKKGYIKRRTHGERAIKLIEKRNELFFREVVDIPLLGNIAAGRPIEAIEDNTATIPIPSDMAGNKNVYALKVHGDSMIESLIMNGDVIIVEKTEYAKDGDTVVALLEDGTATVKKFFKEPERRMIRLQPANPNYEPLFVENVLIQGKVVGIFRTME